MAMNINCFFIKTFGGAGPSFCAYDGTRALHTMADTKVNGFFNPKARELSAGDLIMCNCLDGNVMYVVDSTPSFDGFGNPISNIMIEDYSVASTIGQKISCIVATTGNIILSGLQLIDGYNVIAGNRVLVKSQDDATKNGIYIASETTWKRALDCNAYSEVIYSSVYIEQGSINKNTGWVFTNPNGGQIDIDPVFIAKSSGSGATSNVGDYKMSAILSNHAGWYLCNGDALSRTTYSSLFTVIGVSFGPGDGSTTFNLPDFQGRVFGGIGAGLGLTIRRMGQSAGEEAHTLTTTELPSHSHGYSAPNSTTGDANRGVLFATTFNASNSPTGLTTSNTGSGNPHNVMQPTLFGGNVFMYAGV